MTDREPADQPDHVDGIAAQWDAERPDLDTSAMQIIGRLHRLAAALDVELRRVYDRYGISDGEFDVLCSLRRAGHPHQLTAGGIAVTTMVTAGAVSKRLDRLEAAGLVVRTVCDDDARTRRIRLTDAGLALIDAAFADHMANEARLVAGFTPQQRTELRALLRQWGQDLTRSAQSGT